MMLVEASKTYVEVAKMNCNEEIVTKKSNKRSQKMCNFESNAQKARPKRTVAKLNNMDNIVERVCTVEYCDRESDARMKCAFCKNR